QADSTQEQIEELTNELSGLNVSWQQSQTEKAAVQQRLLTLQNQLDTAQQLQANAQKLLLKEQAKTESFTQHATQLNTEIAALRYAQDEHEAALRTSNEKVKLYQKVALEAEAELQALNEKASNDVLLQDSLQRARQSLLTLAQKQRDLEAERDLLRSQLLLNQNDLAQLHDSMAVLQQASTLAAAAKAQDTASAHQIAALEQELRQTWYAMDKARQLAEANQAKYEEAVRRQESAEAFAREMQAVAMEQIAAKEAMEATSKTTLPAPNEVMAPTSSIVYRVQVLVSPQRVSLDSSFFSGHPQVMEYHHDTEYKYTIGHLSDYESAEVLRDQLKAEGFEYPLVVAFKGDQRIALKEAIEATEAVLGDL
ncbi:MAG: hypothetical protein ACFB10_20515, partial [Salibacteraceae bacterium]